MVASTIANDVFISALLSAQTILSVIKFYICTGLARWHLPYALWHLPHGPAMGYRSAPFTSAAIGINVFMPSFSAKPDRTASSAPKRIVFLAFEGFLAVDLMGSADAFFVANRVATRPLYELEYVSAKGGRVTTAAGLVVHTRPVKDVLSSRFDTLVVAGG